MNGIISIEKIKVMKFFDRCHSVLYWSTSSFEIILPEGFISFLAILFITIIVMIIK